MIIAKAVKGLSITQIQDIIRYLQLMAIGVNIVRTHGICENLDRFCVEYNIPLDGYEFVQKIAPHWPNFSGYIGYPIPYQGWHSVDAYVLVPLWVGEYGKNRKELCLFLANQLQDFIKADCTP